MDRVGPVIPHAVLNERVSCQRRSASLASLSGGAIAVASGMT